MKKMNAREQVHISLVKTIERIGFPIEFGELIAGSLGTEKQMARMISWIIQYKPTSAEDIADEMLAIKDDFKKYRDKKIAEYYNSKYNQLLNSGPLDDDEVDIPLGCYMLDEVVTIKVDYPIGSYIKNLHKIFCTQNFGFAEGYIDKQNRVQRAYVIGIDKPIDMFTGKVKAVIERQDDNNEIWVIAPEGFIATKDEIANLVAFQEQYHDISVVM